MATLTIRGLDDAVRDRLRVRAARHGRSMEAEVREILTAAVDDHEDERGLGSKIHALFAEIGGVEPDELVIPARTGKPRYVDFDE
ncbi:plasmid stabilization protein [Geodermatophilus sp. TF02-6]|uniref:FitA-like ribbon-helix-helix domain-containing protein n=1 Tax=Geodermatophilus sp. TF02-6 TaxID=2250575 RepID=UPI000DE9CC0C|nr:Arc family DNA-binding protein [Geodermatophilus sp. TF02-6]RBY77753.1 plasmid stabilization protein [Geodermatophilus sp. TF02-6]